MPEARQTMTVVPRRQWRGPVFAANTNAASFASIAPTLTNPPTESSSSGIGIITPDLSVTKLAFFGTGAANQTFDLKIVAWSKAEKLVSGTDDVDVREWIPSGLAFLTVTLGATTGVADGVVGGTSQLMADKVEQAASGYATSAINLISPDDGVPAVVEVSHGGAERVGLYFDMTGATNANALYMHT